MSSDRTPTTFRAFLNSRDEMLESAIVVWQVEVSNEYLYATFKLSDCSRMITLDFDCNTNEPDRINAIRRKVDTLYRAVKQFRAAVLEELKP